MKLILNSLVVGNTTRSGFSGGGVIFRAHQELESQGLLETTDSGTDMGINGRGFFVVSDDINNQPSGYNFSRNGNFVKNEDGFLVNSEGMFLMAQRTDENGNVISLASNDLTSTEPVNVGAVAGTAQATENITFDLNVPADAPLFDALNPGDGGQYNSSVQIYDALGIGHDIALIWTKTAVNEWSVEFDSLTQVDTVPPLDSLNGDFIDVGNGTNTMTVSFNGDGSLAAFNPATPQITIPTLVQGGLVPQVIDLDMGTIGLYRWCFTICRNNG